MNPLEDQGVVSRLLSGERVSGCGLKDGEGKMGDAPKHRGFGSSARHT